jgi:hypothetical protein
MVFIGERKGREVEMNTPGPSWQGGGRKGDGGWNLQSYLGLGKTVSCCSLFFKQFLAMSLRYLGSGATSVWQ